MFHIIEQDDSRKLKTFSFLATLIIVFYHSKYFLCDSGFFNDQILGIIFRGYELIASIAMSYFFMATGYLLYHNINRSNIKCKLINRVKTLVIPFVIWNTIYMIWDIFIRQHPIGNFKKILLHFTLSPYDGPLWYIFAILVLLILIPILANLKENYKLCIVITSTLCIISVILNLFFDDLKLVFVSGEVSSWLGRLFRYLPAYLIGSCVGLINPNLLKTKKNKKLIFFIPLFIVFSIFYIFSRSSFNFINSIVVIAFSIYLWELIPSEWFHNTRYSKVCRNSFLIYAIHTMAIYYISKYSKYLYGFILDIGSGELYILFSILLAFSTPIIVYFICLFLEKLLTLIKCKKILRLLTGCRN